MPATTPRPETTESSAPSGASASAAPTSLTVIDDPLAARVKLQGRLDTAGVDAVEARFYAATASARHAVVDLSGVPLVTSLGMRMLVIAAKRMAAAGRSLILLRPQKLVDESLRAADLYRLIPVADNEAQAQALLEGRATA
ncbi:MAG: STAS domain-containing protein [Holophagales bacterium]|nr:STAS domain-containing protein [Holophagales bacterium]